MKYFILLCFVLGSTGIFAQDDEYVSLQDRLKSNIFLKTEASATDCYVGEPIMVTYKLYSAMASESSVIKSPAFSGFDVKNIKSSADEIASRETVDGVGFDVHTILKLQLTPYKAGRLTLGALVMKNRVKLVDANGNEDPVLNGVKEGYTLSNGYFNLNISSVPISVLVTGLPDNKTASGMNGLVGDFKMNVQIPKTIYAPGEQGLFTITILGTGDFTKVKLPEIDWPAGVETAPAKIDDDKSLKADGSGYKSFQIPFKTSKPGKYTIPSVRFSFFDALSGQYKTITNIPLTFSVVKEGAATVSDSRNEEKDEHRNIILIIAAGAVMVLLLLAILFQRSKKNRHRSEPVKEKKQPPQKPGKIIAPEPALSIDELLRSAADRIHYTGNDFYSALKQGLMQYFEQRFALPAALFNKDSLKRSMSDNHIPDEKQKEIITLLTEMDMNIYSGGGLDGNKQELLSKTKRVLAHL
ncbi:MAG: hypothetical protein QM640_07975 [Niabella sp.]